MNRRFLLVSIDVLILIISFLFFAWLKPGTKAIVIPQYIKPFVFFLLIWVISSLASKKYVPAKFKSRSEIFKIIVQANFFSLAIVATFIYTFHLFQVSRSLLFGTIGLASLLELMLAWGYNMVLNAKLVDIENGKATAAKFQSYLQADELNPDARLKKTGKGKRTISPGLLKMIGIEFGDEVRQMITRQAGDLKGDIQVVSTTTRFNIAALVEDHYNCIINLHRVNDIRWLNKFFETVNSKLVHGGIFIGKAETYQLHKKSLLKKYITPANYIIYLFDFLIRRVLPKLPVLKGFYFWLTNGRDRLLSRAETLGRLYSCGFKVLEEQFINDELYFVVSKNGDPLFPETPSYGPLVKLRRIGKGGQFINVYKIRTMYPFSEYIQEYVYNLYGSKDGDKITNDFRIASWGKFMRKLWLDELPMFYNFFKGDIKLVGIRPLSKHKFYTYPEYLQKLRIKYKPGLVPPFYADLPKTEEEFYKSEEAYLLSYGKSPFITDIKYFFRAMSNILFRNARSS
jgi:lipopolysaccharide/colanic/teichoic acid biosynthesis glycosyltransferase